MLIAPTAITTTFFPGTLTIRKTGAWFEATGPMFAGIVRLQNPQPLIEEARRGSLKRLVTRIVFHD